MRKLLIILLLFIGIAKSSPENVSNQIKLTIYNLDLDYAINNICEHNPKKLCKILKDPRVYNYLKRYYKPALYTIAQHESGNFRYNRGIVNKNDISYMQINLEYWTPLKIYKKFGIRVKVKQLHYNIPLSVLVAQHIWLYNIANYISHTGRYPRNLAEYIALYHSVRYISRNYTIKIKKVVYKNIYNFK